MRGGAREHESGLVRRFGMTSADAAAPLEDGHDVALELGRLDDDVRQPAG